MYPEEMPQWNAEDLLPDAGKGQFERSENWSFPATPPATGVPTPDVAPVAEYFDTDEPWEEAPAAPLAEALPDSLSWGEAVTPPVPKTRRRGTLAPGVERPQLPISSQQKLLLLDTWQRSGML